MHERVVDYKSQKEFHNFVAGAYSDLEKYKAKGDLTSFNKLLFPTLAQVKRYITKRLNTALTKGNLPKGKYCADDFVDQLYIIAYEHFNEIKEKGDLYPWLFKKADEILEDTIVDEEFDDRFFKNIDVFMKLEWDQMVEKFSTDGDGDLVMIDELDDISYLKNNNVLSHVFVADDNNEMNAQLDKALGEEKIRKHAALVLHNLPLPMRTVFELATEYQFTLEEIAIIRDHSFKEVRQLLENARKSLETSFLNVNAL